MLANVFSVNFKFKQCGSNAVWACASHTGAVVPALKILNIILMSSYPFDFGNKEKKSATKEICEGENRDLLSKQDNRTIWVGPPPLRGRIASV